MDATPIEIAMMRQALDQARRAADMDEVPVGAVVFRGEQVLAVGHNLRESDNDPTAHAEIVALRQAAKVIGSWRLEDCGMVVTLEPCPMCAGAMVNARVARLIYGAADPKMGAVHTLYQLCTDTRLNHRLEVISGVLAGECGTMLSDFFKRRRQV